MSTSTPSQIGQQFHPFPRLPFELRRTIWKLCRPHRVIDIDLTPSQEDLATACQVWQTSVRNSRPSILTRICKESRNVIFERDEGHDESLVQHTESDIFGYYTNIDWFNASTDIINLNVRYKLFAYFCLSTYDVCLLCAFCLIFGFCRASL
jgi:hypothetical protein